MSLITSGVQKLKARALRASALPFRDSLFCIVSDYECRLQSNRDGQKPGGLPGALAGTRTLSIASKGSPSRTSLTEARGDCPKPWSQFSESWTQRTDQHHPEPFLKDAKPVLEIRDVPVASPLQPLDLEIFIDDSFDRAGVARGLMVRDLESNGIRFTSGGVNGARTRNLCRDRAAL